MSEWMDWMRRVDQRLENIEKALFRARGNGTGKRGYTNPPAPDGYEYVCAVAKGMNLNARDVSSICRLGIIPGVKKANPKMKVSAYIAPIGVFARFVEDNNSMFIKGEDA